MIALHHTAGRAAPMPCRSRTTGRYMPASRQLADRLDRVEADVERAFDALRPLEAALDRAGEGPIAAADVAALRRAHGLLWSALEKAADDLDGARELVGVAHG